MDVLAFSILMVVIIAISGVLSIAVGGPGIVGVFSACVPRICGAPLAFLLFFNPTFEWRVRGKLRFILPATIPILIASILIGWSLYDQNPQVMFKRIMSDPIPAGVSHIRSNDHSGGFDVGYDLAFDAPPDVIEYLISKNGLTLNTDDSNLNRYAAPFDKFPDVNREQEWSFYTKVDNEHRNWWFLWVNADKTTVLFKFMGG
jgi:hypothetical protein